MLDDRTRDALIAARMKPRNAALLAPLIPAVTLFDPLIMREITRRRLLFERIGRARNEVRTGGKRRNCTLPIGAWTPITPIGMNS